MLKYLPIAFPVGLYYKNYSKQTTASSKSSTPNTLTTGYCNIPHAKKAYRGGEDAWIATDALVAVADGVGGWNKKGVDPGIFARELCAHVLSRYVSWQTNKKRFEVDLWELLV